VIKLLLGCVSDSHRESPSLDRGPRGYGWEFCIGSGSEFYTLFSSIQTAIITVCTVKDWDKIQGTVVMPVSLGIPMHYKNLNNKDWKTIEEQIEKKLSSWKGKNLLVGGGGRLVLINSVLSSLSILCYPSLRF
jgi:hypothetical protein